MKTILEVAVVVTIWYSSARSAETKTSNVTYIYGFKCYFGHQRLDDNSNVYLQYHGDPLLCDEISFLGQNAGDGTQYQLCLTPVYYRDPYCQVSVQYKSYATGKILQTLKCNDNHTRQTWCSEETSNIYVRILMESFVRQRTEARILIKLEAKPKKQISEKSDAHTRYIFFAFLGLLQIPIFVAIFRLVQQIAKRRKVLEDVNMEREATENADKPPSYFEATHPQINTHLHTNTPTHLQTATPTHAQTATPTHPKTATPTHPQTATPTHPQTVTQAITPKQAPRPPEYSDVVI